MWNNYYYYCSRCGQFYSPQMLHNCPISQTAFYPHQVPQKEYVYCSSKGDLEQIIEKAIKKAIKDSKEKK